MTEEEGPFTKEAVDMDEWKRRARNVNAAIRVLRIETKAPKASRLSKLTTKVANKKLRMGSSHSAS